MNLSNIELYYTDSSNKKENELILTGDEFYHAVKVMRHKTDDEIYITCGEGKIYQCSIIRIEKQELISQIKHTFEYQNKFSRIFFCIPKIKSADRFEFALEKCVELGITNFIIFESERSYKKGEKPERWKKIVTAAMKQSLRSYLPSIMYLKSVDEIAALEGEKIILEQNADKSLSEIKFEINKDYYFVFGPEGGLSSGEVELINNAKQFKLTDSRLRSETAIVSCASLLTSIHSNE